MPTWTIFSATSAKPASIINCFSFEPMSISVPNCLEASLMLSTISFRFGAFFSSGSDLERTWALYSCLGRSEHSKQHVYDGGRSVR